MRIADDGVVTEQIGRALDEAVGIKPIAKKDEPASPAKPPFPVRALDNSAAGRAPFIPHEE